ncbi:MAG: hypothetical protein QM784_27065 [Polyangiaceae bacterium]
MALGRPGIAFAAAPKSVEEAVRHASWLKGRGHVEEAKELLERWAELSPTSELLAMARADLYLAENNPFWALRVLGAFIEEHGPACEARAQASRIQISQADLEAAEALLDEPACNKTEPLEVRRLLLRAEIAELRGDSKRALELVREAGTHRVRYAEDDARLRKLERAYDPDRLPLFTASLDVGAGWASTGLGHLPLDVATPTRTPKKSALTSVHLLGRWVLPYKPAFRPLAEVEFGGTEILTNRSPDCNYRKSALRLGALIGRGVPRLELAYAFDVASAPGYVDDSHAFAAFSTAHRGEYRLDLGRGFFAFGLLGHRSFADDRLTRVESEQGVLERLELSDTLALETGALLRTYRARSRGFDQVGGSAFVGLTIAAPKGFELRENVTLGADRFPASEGYWGNSRERRDHLLRVGLALLAPETNLFRFALTYDYVNRDSRVDAYDFEDHRALLEVRFRFDSDDLTKRTIGPEGRVPLQHEKETPKAVEAERMSTREAVQRDEQMRRGSSCLK